MDYPHFHTDAAQAGNYLSLYIDMLGVDMLSLNGSKIYGPKSSGILFKKEYVKISPFYFGGGQERNIFSGTLDIEKCVGISFALEEVQKEYKNQKTIIKGDQKEKIISLASVVAKVDRDKKMNSFHKKYPQYLWSKNKGYGTREHYRAIRKNGLTILHRKSFLASIGRRLTKI
jgi:cysteine sulfinate desulfinase/cysteine desulfurase-like protein